MVTTTTRSGSATSGPARMRVASRPSSSGMRMSSRQTSGRRCRASATAERPLSASPTTSMSPLASRIILKPVRTMAWSSASTTRITGSPHPPGSPGSRGGPGGGGIEREPGLHPPAVARRVDRPGGEGAAQRLGPFVHAGETVSVSVDPVASTSPTRRTSTSARVASTAWRRTLVSDSWTMRCVDAATAPGRWLRARWSTARATARPSVLLAATRSSRPASPTGGAMGAVGDDPSSFRSDPTRRRMAVRASLPAPSIWSSASPAAAGSRSATTRAAWACTTMPVT